ncbi:hypothetical protein Pelo_18723 [Pelomyxa schiedti]|nr:hypothetical protein Pelo_18723 [Pelomyxa schiedti]
MPDCFELWDCNSGKVRASKHREGCTEVEANSGFLFHKSNTHFEVTDVLSSPSDLPILTVDFSTDSYSSFVSPGGKKFCGLYGRSIFPQLRSSVASMVARKIQIPQHPLQHNMSRHRKIDALEHELNIALEERDTALRIGNLQRAQMEVLRQREEAIGCLSVARTANEQMAATIANLRRENLALKKERDDAFQQIELNGLGTTT